MKSKTPPTAGIQDKRTTVNKALRINLDGERYGSFAEIGAGQEVARHFFNAGKASQTVALTISAYDMTFSDHIYGKESSGRYVCESRLLKMLKHEYQKLEDRLGTARGDQTCFFAFASTVATSADPKKQSHGWVGLRFQNKPRGPYNDIILHVRMKDRQRLLQQETLGILGVNLCYSAFYFLNNGPEFISQIVDNIKDDSLVIDMIQTTGPDVEKFDNRLLNIELVRTGFSEAILFDPQMKVVTISDAVWNKAILVQRGHYKPITNSHLDILKKGCHQLKSDFKLRDNQFLPILEFNTSKLQSKEQIDEQEYLLRIESLCGLGHYVLVSNLDLFYKIKDLLRKSTNKPIAIVVAAHHLEKIFDANHYADLSGGLLEGLGRLLDQETRLYVYPDKTEEICLTTKSFFPKDNLSLIYQYFLKQSWVSDIAGCDEIERHWHSDEIFAMIQKGQTQWEKLVPPSVKEIIKKNKMFRLKKSGS